MARTSSKKKDEAGEAPVSIDLVHPDGERHYETTTPAELYNLVSGYGYRIAEDGLSLDDAAARLAVNVTGSADAAGDGAAPAAGTTPSTTTTTTTTSGTSGTGT